MKKSQKGVGYTLPVAFFHEVDQKGEGVEKKKSDRTIYGEAPDEEGESLRKVTCTNGA